MSSSQAAAPITLFQYGDDPLLHRYVDHQNQLSFTVGGALGVQCPAAHSTDNVSPLHIRATPHVLQFAQNEDPNRVIRLTRDTAWVQQHSSMLGPDKSYFYMGPENSMGYIMYGGGNITLPMAFLLRSGKKEGSTSRYWRAQSGATYKWKATTHRMECIDNGRTLALWEVSSPDKNYYAKLTIYSKAMPLITEVMTTLILNQMALALTWPL